MPVPINATRHAIRVLRRTLLATALTCSWACVAPMQAAQFESDESAPSVLAMPPAAQESPLGGTEIEGSPAIPFGDRAAFDGVGSSFEAFLCGPDYCPGADCDPPGLLQYLGPIGKGCWVARADGLLLWRDGPTSRPLLITGDGIGNAVLNADQLESTATGGIRGSLIRLDGCSGHGWEFGYLYAGTFTSRQPLPENPAFPYALADPPIFGNTTAQPFEFGSATLLAQLQGAECNRLLATSPNLRWLAGFRWVQWRESFSLLGTNTQQVPEVNDYYNTNCLNNLYGGQIGVDAKLLTLGRLRIDSLVKAGAFYNAASQSSVYATDDPVNPGVADVTVSESPAACSFVGEVGMTGALALTSNVDFRFGYVALWLTGLAQPTRQLSGQQLSPGLPEIGSLDASGGTLVQGLTLGLEGRW